MTQLEAFQAFAALRHEQARQRAPSDAERERARCIVWAARIRTLQLM